MHLYIHQWRFLGILVLMGLMLLHGVLPAQDTPPVSTDTPGGTKPERPLPPGVKLYATVEPDEIILGDRFEYSIVLEGNVVPDKVDYPPFQGTGGIELIQGPSQHQSYTSIGGRGSVVYSLKFGLRAANLGDYTIPPARLRINGVWYATEQITITIRDVPKGDTDLEGVISARTRYNDINKQLEGRYFALAETPDIAYYGQAVPVKVYIYRDPKLPEFAQWQIGEPAGGTDFLAPDIVTNNPLGQTWNWQTVELSGQSFQRALLMTTFVVPTRTGQLRLKPPLIRIALPVQRRYGNQDLGDLFGMMGPIADSEPADLQMRMTTLDVRPPPPKPDDALAQIVGEGEVTASVDRDRVPHRELVSFKIKVRGEGFFDLLSKPELPELPNLTLVDTEVSSLPLEVRQGLLLGERTFEYVYQAVRPGEVDLPSLKFAFFNPKTGEQRTVTTEPIRLDIIADQSESVRITGGDVAVRGPVGPTINQADARVLGQDVSFIETTPLTAAGVSAASAFYTRPWFWMLQLLPALAAIGYGFVAIRAAGNADETAEQRRRRGKRAVSETLREAHQGAATASREEYYNMLALGLRGYIGSLIGRSPQGLTIEEGANALRQKSVSDATISRVSRLLGECDTIRYSPAPDTPESRKAALDDAESIIGQLESEVSK